MWKCGEKEEKKGDGSVDVRTQLAAQHCKPPRHGGRGRRPLTPGRPAHTATGTHDWAWGSAASSGAEWPARPLAQQASMMLGARPRSRSQQQATGIHKASHPRLLRCGRGGRGPTTY
jgi:hypothetical protein